MNADVRLLLSDIDGTLVPPDKVLTERSIRAVNDLRDAGIISRSPAAVPREACVCTSSRCS